MRPQRPCIWPTFIFWALLVAAQGATPAAEHITPHVSQCNYCASCDVGSSTDPAFQLPSLKLLEPDDGEASDKAKLPNCTACWGCNTRLTSLDNLTAFGRSYPVSLSKSVLWPFIANLPNSKAMVKLFCIPLSKWKPSLAAKRCFSVDRGDRTATINMIKAMQMLREECGMTDVVAKSWMGPVSAVIPEIGYHIRWQGVYTEYVDGINMWALANEGKPKPLEPRNLLDLLHNKLNSTQVLTAVIFDLLTSQCGRHPHNVIITEQGQLKLVDNDLALQDRDAICGFNSVFLPTTSKNFRWMVSPVIPNRINPLSRFDYRCHLPKGSTGIRTNYPSQVQQCLIRLSSQTVDQIQKRYNVTRLAAWNLQIRSTDMLTKGFEWTLKHGEPQNPPKLRFESPQDVCCKVTWDGSSYQCGKYVSVEDDA